MYQAKKEDVVMALGMKFMPRIQGFNPYLLKIMNGQAYATGLIFAEILIH